MMCATLKSPSPSVNKLINNERVPRCLNNNFLQPDEIDLYGKYRQSPSHLHLFVLSSCTIQYTNHIRPRLHFVQSVHFCFVIVSVFSFHAHPEPSSIVIHIFVSSSCFPF